MTAINNLSKVGFESLDPTIHRRIIMSIWGHDGHGKTHFAFTAPGPIALFNLDIGYEGVVDKFFGTKEIYPMRIEVPRDGDNCKAEAIALWDKFNTAYDVALKETRTVIIDTATELWALLRIARFGKLSQVQPYQYTPVNAEFSSIIKRALNSVGTNVIYVHRSRDSYVNDKKTGEYEQAGFSGMLFDVQFRGRIFRMDPDEDRPNVEFGVSVEKCRHNTNLVGQTFGGPLATFPMIAQLVIPGTKMEDWT